MGSVKKDNASEETDLSDFPNRLNQVAFFLGLLFFYLVTVFGNNIVVVRWILNIITSCNFFSVIYPSSLISVTPFSWEPSVLGLLLQGLPYHFPYQLLGPDDHIPLSWGWHVSPCYHGLWQVCCNLQSPALHHHYEQLGLHTVGLGNLD